MTRDAPKQTGGVLAMDHGTKRTGFAVSDALRLVTQPLDPWHGDGSSPVLIDHPFGIPQAPGGRSALATDLLTRWLPALEGVARKLQTVRKRWPASAGPRHCSTAISGR